MHTSLARRLYLLISKTAWHSSSHSIASSAVVCIVYFGSWPSLSVLARLLYQCNAVLSTYHRSLLISSAMYIYMLLLLFNAIRLDFRFTPATLLPQIPSVTPLHMIPLKMSLCILTFSFEWVGCLVSCFRRHCLREDISALGKYRSTCQTSCHGYTVKYLRSQRIVSEPAE